MQRVISILLIFIFIFSLNCISLAEKTFPEPGAPSVILINSKTGQILYEKNINEKLYPASITKVMTALLTLENCNLNDKVVASKRAVYEIEPGSNTASIQPGEVLTVEQLLYALLLNSANEAANVLAEHVGGSIEGFAKMMNERAKELGALNTHFVTPNGLHKDDHYTTVYDMSLIAKQAMTIPKFRQIVSTVTYKMPPTNKYKKTDRCFLNSNKLIKKTSYYYPYAIGIKTGYTTKAGHSIIAGASKNGMELICVIMNARIDNGVSQIYNDPKKLFDYVFDNYTVQKQIAAGETFKSIPLDESKKSEQLQLVAENSMELLVPVGSTQSVTIQEFIPSDLKAPITKGTQIGYAEYLFDNKVIGKVNLIAGNDIKNANFFTSKPGSIIKSAFVIVRNIVLALLALSIAIISILRFKFKNEKKKQLRRLKIDSLLED